MGIIRLKGRWNWLVAAVLLGGVSATPELVAQPPPESDVLPEETREAWERTDYGSGPDRRIHFPRLEQREITPVGYHRDVFVRCFAFDPFDNTRR